MTHTFKNLVMWAVAALVIFLFWSVSSRIQEQEKFLSFSDFMGQVEDGRVQRVVIVSSPAGSEIYGDLTNGQAFRTFAPPQAQYFVELLLDKGVEVNARNAQQATWLGHLISWTPILVMIGFLVFFMRSMRDASKRSVASAVSRKEQRLEAKSRIFFTLASGGKELTEEELASTLSGKPMSALEREEMRRALYEMLAEGTLRFTADEKLTVRSS